MVRKDSPTEGHLDTEPDDRLYNYIGEKIRLLRERLGWTQDRLARELDVTPNTISRWETATYRPSAVDLDRLARVFGVPIWAFFPPSIEAPTEAQKALLSATGDLPQEDLEELQRYADFIRARKVMLTSGRAKRRARRGPEDT